MQMRKTMGLVTSDDLSFIKIYTISPVTLFLFFIFLNIFYVDKLQILFKAKTKKMKVRIVVFLILLVLFAQLTVAKNSGKKKENSKESVSGKDGDSEKGDWDDSKKKQSKGEVAAKAKQESSPAKLQTKEQINTPAKEDSIQTDNT